ncbi:hypothetical protein Trydic_g8335 [Trypoxylus dichotomus]
MITEGVEKKEPTSQDSLEVYKIRWLILGIFVLYSASNAMQWIQYSIIANIITEFYGVSSIAVDWTSMIYMVLYIPTVFPASFFLDKYGLRLTVLLGSIGTCVGSWIKVGSVDPSLFWVTFLGQSIVALSQACILSIPAKLAAAWFGPQQVSSACSIGVFGNQLGVAIGFLIPPMIVRSGSQSEIKPQLYTLFIGNGIITSVITVLIAIFFKNGPPTAPSRAEASKSGEVSVNTNFLKSLKALITNKNYILLVLSYGINVGIFYAISTLLNQIVLAHYPNRETDAGRIGLLIVFAGMIGSVICGILLDKTRKFKETTLAVYILSLLGMIIYTFTLNTNIVIVYIVSTFLGFSMTGLLPVGFELASELTFPEPEGTSTGVLNASSQLFGVIFTSLYSVLFSELGDQWANGIMCIMLAVGVLMTAGIKADLRRQAASCDNNEE